MQTTATQPPPEPEEEVTYDTKSFDYGKYILVWRYTVLSALSG